MTGEASLPSPGGVDGAIAPLHLVTDDRILLRSDFLARALEVREAAGKRAALHLRGPGVPGRRLHELLVRIRREEGEAGPGRGPILVNDRVDVALAGGAEGVQLGRRSLPIRDARRLVGPSRLVGASVHGTEEAVEARADGADLLLVGTIFPTPSHPSRPGAGLGLLAAVRERTAGPILAIGGVSAERVSAVLDAGADGVAVVRAVWDAPVPARAAEELIRKLEGRA